MRGGRERPLGLETWQNSFISLVGRFCKLGKKKVVPDEIVGFTLTP